MISNLQKFLQGLRSVAQEKRSIKNWEDISSFQNEELKALTSLSGQEFQQLFEFCDPIVQYGNRRRVTEKHLLTFLIKIRHGVSDEFLRLLLNYYPPRPTLSLIISYVRLSLLERFVPNNIGFNSIPRETYIERHISFYINHLYNPHPNIPKAIVYIDCTYNKIAKSSNFRVLRQSYCFHKHEHLLEPEMIVASDGYILAINGPYFSDAKNSDPSILARELHDDMEGMRNWFEEGDIIIADRGYTDSVPLLQELGLHVHMPPFLQPNQRQLTTAEANRARIITTSRWIIEARNGHFKSIFKFFRGMISTTHAANLRDFYLIGGALLNTYHPLISLEGTPEIATQMLNACDEVNIVQARVEAHNLHLRHGVWVRLNFRHAVSFPRLDLEYLKSFTGSYHIHLAASYIQDTLQRGEGNILEIDELIEETNFLRLRTYSRFRNATKCMLWVVFNENENENPEDPPVQGYYCTCRSGARTLGSCAHVDSVVWFLGFARYQEYIEFPSDRLLNYIIDAADRRWNEDADIGPIVI